MPYSYSKAYRPPAPSLDIEIIHPNRPEVSVEMRGKNDTGGDITTIPTTILSQLQIPPAREVLAIGYDGTESRQRTHLVHLDLVGSRCAYLEVMATSGDQVLIGRDLLNQWIVTLNGPEEQFDIIL